MFWELHNLANPTALARESKSAVQCVRTTLNPEVGTILAGSSWRGRFARICFSSSSSKPSTSSSSAASSSSSSAATPSYQSTIFDLISNVLHPAIPPFVLRKKAVIPGGSFVASERGVERVDQNEGHLCIRWFRCMLHHHHWQSILETNSIKDTASRAPENVYGRGGRWVALGFVRVVIVVVATSWITKKGTPRIPYVVSFPEQILARQGPLPLP